MNELIILVLSVFGGFLGALLGLGGGIIVVPALTLILGVDIRYAIAASLISIIATSSGAAAGYLRDRLTNLRIAVFLEIGTVTGAVVGFLLASHLHASFLYLLFGGFLAVSAVLMLRERGDHRAAINHPWSTALGFASSYPDKDGKPLSYNVEQVPLALFAMFFAGILSALLGIGSGILKVIAMDGAMKLPMKVSSATSNFMIGVTATASAGAYFFRGDVQPAIAAPVAIGIIIGSWIGAKAMVRLPSRLIRQIFVAVLIIVSVQMIWRGLHL